MSELRIGLIGAGYMGALHAEKLSVLQERGHGLRLVGVADLIASRAEAIGRRYGVPAYGDFRGLLPALDAAIVAVPTVAHHGVVRLALNAGVDVLVEKPIAATLDEAEQLLSLAQKNRCVLQVGHLEWFNSAMQAIRDHIDRPIFIDAQRVGPFPDRATDIDVVRDLMIHDLDILQQLLGDEPERIEAVGVPVIGPNVDIANARLVWKNGCVANLTASRVSPTPMRRIRFFESDGYFSVDFLAQAAVAARRESVAGEPARIEVEKLEVPRGDALLAQLEAFEEALRTRSRPRVDGAGGLGALRTALRVNAAMPPVASREE
jgi:predicted dehydrogenase